MRLDFSAEAISLPLRSASFSRIIIQRALRIHHPIHRTWKAVAYCSHYNEALTFLKALNTSPRWVYRIDPTTQPPFNLNPLAQDLSP